jgi:enoyl-CoA hydratase/carnithine racemase
MTEATASLVTLQRLQGHVTLVTLNRPEARNAVNAGLATALEAAVDETESDPDTWAVVLTGAGRGVFCAGADLKEVAAGRGPDLFRPRGGFAGFVDAQRSKPWIAAVNGKALAGGFEIVLACELVVAAESGAFGLPEVTRGLIAAAGGLYRLPRALPRALALELAMTGEPLSAERAREHGLVNRMVAEEQVVDEAVAMAQRITRNAPLAVRESLQIARRACEMDETAARALSKSARDRIAATEDYKEGPRAFVEKREPRWQGR